MQLNLDSFVYKNDNMRNSVQQLMTPTLYKSSESQHSSYQQSSNNKLSGTSEVYQSYNDFIKEMSALRDRVFQLLKQYQKAMEQPIKQRGFSQSIRNDVKDISISYQSILWKLQNTETSIIDLSISDLQSNRRKDLSIMSNLIEDYLKQFNPKQNISLSKIIEDRYPNTSDLIQSNQQDKQPAQPIQFIKSIHQSNTSARIYNLQQLLCTQLDSNYKIYSKMILLDMMKQLHKLDNYGEEAQVIDKLLYKVEIIIRHINKSDFGTMVLYDYLESIIQQTYSN